MSTQTRHHSVEDKTPYPSIFLLADDNDPRDDSRHSRKMIARLQGAPSSKNTLLLRTNIAGGHGLGGPLSDQIDEYTDVFAF